MLVRAVYLGQRAYRLLHAGAGDMPLNAPFPCVICPYDPHNLLPLSISHPCPSKIMDEGGSYPMDKQEALIVVVAAALGAIVEYLVLKKGGVR